jgi:hypothetical protein
VNWRKTSWPAWRARKTYQDILARKANLLPAFQQDIQPMSQPLLRDLFGWKQAGRIYGLYHDQLPAEFGADFWSPLLETACSKRPVEQTVY